jgi:hypothetical protein
MEAKGDPPVSSAAHPPTRRHPEDPRVWGPDRTECDWGKRTEGSAFRKLKSGKNSGEDGDLLYLSLWFGHW